MLLSVPVMCASDGFSDDDVAELLSLPVLRQRKIIHVDMDAFYASVEQLDDPSLKGKPIVVGGSRERGVVAAASYEARRFGVRSAMPSVTARRLCRDLVFVPPRFDRYREISRIVQGIFEEYTPLVEPMSLDEAYLDVTDDIRAMGSAMRTAEAIRRDILDRTGLTASAGVSFNKFLAKMASDMRKPDGLFVIRPERAADLVAGIDVAKFHGIGPATAARMKAMGIHTGADLRMRDAVELGAEFGKSGRHFHEIAWGRDDRPVIPDRERKSFGSERTFLRDLRERADLVEALRDILESVWSDRERTGRMGRTVTLKMKYSDFRLISRSKTDHVAICDRAWLDATATGLLDGLLPVHKGVRLIGVSVSNLVEADRCMSGQMPLL